MIRFLTWGAAIALFSLSATNSYADDYGERFYNHTPTGLAEFSESNHESLDIAIDDIARELQGTMPAAGDEEAEGDAQQEEKKKIQDVSAATK